MLFNNNKIKCTLLCINKDIKYSARDGKNFREYLFSFKVVEPENLNYKTYSQYSDEDLYDENKYYNAIYNTKTNTFTIK